MNSRHVLPNSNSFSADGRIVGSFYYVPSACLMFFSMDIIISTFKEF